MIKLKVVNHSASDRELLVRAASVKQKAWPYPIESQLEWIRKNLSNDDLHLFLQVDGEDVAYMNLVDIHFHADSMAYHGYGIGNVCAAIKGLGYGGKLLSLTNDFLKMTGRPGLLFCMPHVEKFYNHYGWQKVEREKTIIDGLSQEASVFSYSLPPVSQSLIYNGKLF